MVDDVELVDIETIQEAIEEAFKEYPDKRINLQIQDDPLVKRSR